jgi:hypothetical protein
VKLKRQSANVDLLVAKMLAVAQQPADVAGGERFLGGGRRGGLRRRGVRGRCWGRRGRDGCAATSLRCRGCGWRSGGGPFRRRSGCARTCGRCGGALCGAGGARWACDGGLGEALGGPPGRRLGLHRARWPGARRSRPCRSGRGPLGFHHA